MYTFIVIALRKLNFRGAFLFKSGKYYDPAEVRNVEFDNAMGQSTDTPAFRALMENTMLQLLQAQQIDIETYLENSSVPYADKLLEGVRRHNREQQEALMAQQQMQAQQQTQ